MNLQRLTVINYAEKMEDKKRITFNPGLIIALAADIEDVVIEGRTLRQVSVLFTDGGSVDVIVNHSDLDKMESAIGTFAVD